MESVIFAGDEFQAMADELFTASPKYHWKDCKISEFEKVWIICGQLSDCSIEFIEDVESCGIEFRILNVFPTMFLCSPWLSNTSLCFNCYDQRILATIDGFLHSKEMELILRSLDSSRFSACPALPKSAIHVLKERIVKNEKDVDFGLYYGIDILNLDYWDGLIEPFCGCCGE